MIKNAWKQISREHWSNSWMEIQSDYEKATMEKWILECIFQAPEDISGIHSYHLMENQRVEM